MILLACLPPSYENFVSSLIVSKDSITLEEVKSSLYSRELRLKAFGNGDEVFTPRLSVRRKEKVVRRAKLMVRTYGTTTKNQIIGSETVQRKQRKILLSLLFRMTPHWKSIWFLVNNYSNIMNNGYWT